MANQKINIKRKSAPETAKNKKSDFKHLVSLFEQAHYAMQTQAARSVDIALVVRNWLFGWYIIEYQQHGSDRAEYGTGLLKTLSKVLSRKLGKGFSVDNLELMRNFYLEFKNKQPESFDKSLALKKSETVSRISELISETTSRNFNPLSTTKSKLGENWLVLSEKFSLSWSHYIALMTIRLTEERRFYEIEALANNWGVRELKRQISSSLYERLALSRDKDKVKELSEKGQLISQPSDILKNPYVLEFLGLEERASYSEHELETAIINKIENFLLELGKGFLFEARQKRFTFNDDHFYVDLVFYNRLLRCYVIIDLKRDKLTHQDLGQMQMYVNYFDRYVKREEEKPTVGILLCHSKDDRIVELTLPENTNIHASEYHLYLPSKKELKKQLEEVQKDWDAQHEG